MAIRRIDLLSCGKLDKTPMKTLDFDAREFSTMGRSMLLLVWEKIKEAILCLPLFMFIIYYNKKSPRSIRPRRFCPSPKVQNILRPPKIRALNCVAKDATSICLAERKPEVWGK